MMWPQKLQLQQQQQRNNNTDSERKMILRPSLTLSAGRNMGRVIDKKRQELGGRQTLFNFPLTPQ